MSSGSPIAGIADSFHFVYQKLPLDGEVSAQIVEQSQLNLGAKVGLMIRESLNTNSPSVFFGLNSTNLLTTVNRKIVSGSGASTSSNSFSAPLWLKLVRTGSSFKAYQSGDGYSWAPFGNALINPMSTNAFLGIAVASYRKTIANQASAAHVNVVGGEAPPSGDSDLDGLSDAWELSYFGNLAQTASDDFDLDGLSSLEEFNRGTNPTLSDTDGDLVSDQIEILQGRNPLKGALADNNHVVNLDLFTPLE